MATIASKVKALQGMSVEALRSEYRKLYGEETTAINKDFLLKKVAWRIQELEYGGVGEDVKEKALGIVESLQLPGRIPTSKPQRKNKPVVPGKAKKDNRLPMPGAVITKEYKGTTVRVEVLEDGFEYDGCKFKSLSAIAKAVTGSHWNGYKFFSL